MQAKKPLGRISKFYFLLIMMFMMDQSLASPGYIHLQSRISKPDGAGYLETASVQFRFSITDPLGTCVLFQEDFTNVDMTGSKGLVNFKVGTGTKTYPAGPMTMPTLFTNFNSPLFTCQAGGTYTAASTDSRKLLMQFNDGSGWQTVPMMEINSVPFALESLASQKLGSYPAADYVRTAQFTSCTGSEAVHFNGTNFTCVALSTGSAYSAITGATSTNTIDNTNYAQNWNWSTATTQSPMTMTANALTTGSLLNLTTSSNSLNSTDGILNVANTGTSTNGVVARIQSNSTVGSGLTVLANGNVGIGTVSPTSILHVVGIDGTGANNGSGITLDSGEATGTGSGGSVNISGGNATTLSGTSGGSVNLTAGAGPGGAGGVLTLRSGNFVSTSTGGSQIQLSASGSLTSGGVAISSGAVSGGGPGSSGQITITTPSAVASGSGGAISLTTGNGQGTGTGGAINLTAGNGGATNVNGANVVINPGAKGGTGADGNVVLANLRGNAGIGTTTPAEKLEVNGGIKVGNTVTNNAGTIRWDGTNFLGYTGSAWQTFVPTPPSSGACNATVTYTSAGTYAYTVPATFGTITIKLWGGGGSGGTASVSTTGAAGGNSSIVSLGLVAGGGGPGPSSAIGTFGAGGIASGGTINVNGPDGTAPSGGFSGAGGTASSGGAGGASRNTYGYGNPGVAPGGGGGGATNTGGPNYGGGGGAGAYVEKSFTSLDVTPGSTISDIVVGSGGVPTINNPITGGYGAVGQVSITCATAGAPPVNDRSIVFQNSGSYGADANFVYSAAGNVGIGTTSPIYPLQISQSAAGDYSPVVLARGHNNHTITMEPEGWQVIGFNRHYNYLAASSQATVTGAYTGYVGFDPSNGSIHFANSASAGTQGANSSESIKMTVTSVGWVGVGNPGPSYQLDVNGDINTTSRLRIAGTEICTVAGCTSSSDIRLKKNIKPLNDSLSKILQIDGVQYNYTDEEKYGTENQIGVIAQQVEKIYPEVVKTDERTGFKSVAYDHLVAPILEAFKEIITRLENVERHNANTKTLVEQNLQLQRKTENLISEITELKKHNQLLEIYLCDKDPQASFCQKK